jgi:hypothetical protein
MTTALTGRQGCTGRLTPLLARGFGPTREQAAGVAMALDLIVDRDLELISAMPQHRSGQLAQRHSSRLAAIVMLAQAYRHFSRGWIGRSQLRCRCRAALDDVTKAGVLPPAAVRS